MITKQDLDKLTYQVLGAAIEVHKTLGAGLLESAYHTCLKHELSLRNIKFQSQMFVPINFKGLTFETELRADLLVENCLVVELKTVSELVSVHTAQLLTYMRLLNAPKGILINFYCTNLYKQGQKTFVNELFRDLPEN